MGIVSLHTVIILLSLWSKISIYFQSSSGLSNNFQMTSRKLAPPPSEATTSHLQKSIIKLTFAVELLGIDVWHDCREGWIDLGPCHQGMKLQYQLYPGKTFDIDILIWPHCVKVWCGDKKVWVRSWQYLERRWIAFSIQHAFPIRVLEMKNHVATVTPTIGLTGLSNNAKNDKNTEVYLPKLKPDEKRYFGKVMAFDEPLLVFIHKLIWRCVEPYIPRTIFDEKFDVPTIVTDVRHQDAIISTVQEQILYESLVPPRPESNKGRGMSLSAKSYKGGTSKSTASVKSYELLLPGENLLSGTGRIIPFKEQGYRSADLGKIIVLLASKNLPASDDLPIIFVNIYELSSTPVQEFLKHRIKGIYTQWKIGKEVHKSSMQPVSKEGHYNFDDHYTVPLLSDGGLQMIAVLADDPFEIELRGVRDPTPEDVKSDLFGKVYNDYVYDIAKPKNKELESNDFLIAVCKIDAKVLAFGNNGLVRGEFSIYPPKVDVEEITRKEMCTNDINAIRRSVTPKLLVQPSAILEAHMTLDVSMGFVGCRLKKLHRCFSQIYCEVRVSDTALELLTLVSNINVELVKHKKYEDVLTGFAIDVGDKVIFYLEGLKGGDILQFWDLTEVNFKDLDIYFSSADKYFDRIYEELVESDMPFIVMKMYVPINELLSCAPIYVRPTLPLPCKSIYIGKGSMLKQAILKIDRILKNELRSFPTRSEMPTLRELKSLSIELCTGMKKFTKVEMEAIAVNLLPGTPRPKPVEILPSPTLPPPQTENIAKGKPRKLK